MCPWDKFPQILELVKYIYILQKLSHDLFSVLQRGRCMHRELEVIFWRCASRVWRTESRQDFSARCIRIRVRFLSLDWAKSINRSSIHGSWGIWLQDKLSFTSVSQVVWMEKTLKCGFVCSAASLQRAASRTQVNCSVAFAVLVCPL